MKPTPYTPALTKRDLTMFQCLAEFGVLSTSQLTQRIFPGVQGSTVLRRLRRLECEGWIYRVDRALPSGESVWLLAKRGEDLIEVETPMVRPNRNGLAHDVQLAALRMHLKSIGLGENFVPDWSIKRQTLDPLSRRQKDGPLVPDGIFSAVLWNKSVATVALELELNAKTTHRYEKIFTKYQEKNNLDLVWYFVKKEGMASALIAKWNRIRGKSYRGRQSSTFLIVTVLPEFERDPREARIHFTDGETRRVAEHFKVSRRPNTPAQGVGRAEEAAA